ncbi:MAG: hypothetical protein HY822_04620 [Acidobacteria bacterium]|nr:hypothetical protein [Acidobacteriota bacterium]
MKRALILLAAAAGLDASSPTAWEMNTYQDFLKGRFQNVSLTRDGRLRLGPALDTLFSSDQPSIWSLAAGPDGSVYAGTGHHGRVFRIDTRGRSEIVFAAEQPEVFALAVDARGVVFAGTSPDGKVYRIEQGKAAEYFDPRSKYIWALRLAPDGALMVGTGDQGKIFRVTAAGKGEVCYETGQNHVTALAFDPAGRLLAGSEPNGILYRIEGPGKAFVLYDANLPEIRGILAGADGSVYIAAMGGGWAGRAGSPAGAGAVGQSGGVTTAVTTSITVEGAAQSGLEIKPKAEAPKPAQPAAAAPAPAPLVDLSGVEKSALYRIAPDHSIDTLWSSKEENVYDFALAGRDVVFSTDVRGRVWRLSADRKATLVAETNEGETTRLVPVAGGWLAASASAGKIFRLREEAAPAGTYESPVHDAGSVAKWGKLTWRDGAGRVAFRTRSGNSARPDRTWSEWSAPLTNPENAQVASPNARYVQWKAEFTGGGDPAEVDSASLAYLRQNNPPVVKSLSVNLQWAGVSPSKPASAQPSQGAAYSVTVTDTGEAGASTAAGTPTQTVVRAAEQQLLISWQAEDPDGDRLVYALYFRGEGEREWKSIRADLTESSLTLDGDALAGGRYLFRVTASDRLVNPGGSAREAELVGAPVLLDNTPPVVTPGAVRRTATGVEIGVQAADGISPLRRAECSVDAGPWFPVEAEDGVADSREERFRVRVETLAAGEHAIVIRVYDAAGNAGLARVLVR